MKYYLITYKNWKDEVADRCILPVSIEFGSNEYHKTPTWLMKAHDVDIKNDNGAVTINVSNNLKTFDMKNILEVKETKELNINQVEKYIFDSSVFPVDLSSEEKIEYLKGTLELEINQNLKEKTVLRKTLDNLCRWNDEQKFKIENLNFKLEDFYKSNQENINEISNLYLTIKNLDEMVKNLVDKIWTLEFKSDQIKRENNLEVSGLIEEISKLYKERADDSHLISKLSKQQSENRLFNSKQSFERLQQMDNSKKNNLNEFTNILVKNNLNEKFLSELGILNQKEANQEYKKVTVEHKPKFEVKSGTKCEKSFGEVIGTVEVPRIRASQAYAQQVKDDLINKMIEFVGKDKTEVVNDLRKSLIAKGLIN